MLGWRLALRQGYQYKGPFTAVAVAILVAITVLASVPIYFNILGELGLRFGLMSGDRIAHHIQIAVPLTPLEPIKNAKVHEVVEKTVDDTVGWFVDEHRIYTQTVPLVFSRAGQPVPSGGQPPRAFLQSLSQVESHVTLLEGSFPEEEVTFFQENDQKFAQVNGMLGIEAARLHDIKPGDLILLNAGRGVDRQRLRIRVTGVVVPTDPKEEYWLGHAVGALGSITLDSLDVDQIADEDIPPMGIFTDEGALLEAMSTAFPDQTGDSLVFIYTNLDQVGVNNMGKVQETLDDLSIGLTNSLPRAITLTTLDSIVTRFKNQTFFSRIPLLVLAVLIELLSLYVLVMVGSSLIDGQRSSMALVTSRGGSSFQILSVYAAEGIVLAGIGMLFGPPLAAFCVALLGLTEPFRGITDGSLLPYRLISDAYLWAFLAAVICVGILMVQAMRGRMAGVAQTKMMRGRTTGLALIRTYYFDVAFVFLAGVFLWDLTERGNLVTRTGFGDLSVDHIAVITPVVFLVTIILVLLRVFPLFLRIFGSLFGSFLPAWAGVGLAQMARRPIFYNHLLILVTLTTGIGWFSATYGATLSRSIQDRVSYDTAADFTIERTGNFPVRDLDLLEALFVKTDGVQSVTTVLDTQVKLGASNSDVSLLAIDPRNAGNIVYFREDFSTSTMTDLMVSLGGATTLGNNLRVVAANADTLGLWVKPEEPLQNVFLYVVVRDSVGTYTRITFGEMNFDDWRYIQGDLRGRTGVARFIPPATIEAIEIFEPTYRRGTAGRILFDGLSVHFKDSEDVELLEGFESVVGWNPIAVSPIRVDTIRAEDAEYKEGRQSIEFDFGRDAIAGIRGFHLNAIDGPIPILANPAFLERMGMGVGDHTILEVGGVLVHVAARDIVDYFSPLNPERPFVVAPLDPLLDYVNMVKGGAPLRPNKILLDLPEDPSLRMTVKGLMEEEGFFQQAVTVDRQQVVADLDLDPLLVTGWRALVLGALAIMLVLIVVGYFAYSFLIAIDRKVEIGIIRALGLSRQDILRLIVLEHSFVLLIGISVGTWAGLQISNFMIPLLSFTDFGRVIVPPFIIEISWPFVTLLGIGIITSVVMTMGAHGMIFTRISAIEVLRAGDT